MERSIAERMPSLINGLWDLGHARGRKVFLGGHICCCGNGCYWFRSYSGSLLNSAKVSKTLLPHHSAPRLGSVCPHSGFGPWAAVMGHPWPRTANLASCQVTHAPKPAFGQRGLTGRLRSRSKARAQRPTGRLECLKAKSKAKAKAGTVQMWELACLRWHHLGVSEKPSCLHRRQASSYRKAAPPCP